MNRNTAFQTYKLSRPLQLVINQLVEEPPTVGFPILYYFKLFKFFKKNPINRKIINTKF